MTALLDGALTTTLGRPRYEGANIRTWIGFKHFLYLVEEAILEYFRERGLGPHVLYHRHGLGLEIVESSVQLPATLQIDDEVRASLLPETPRPGQGAPFAVKLSVAGDGSTVTVLHGRVRVGLVRERDAPGTQPVPAFLEPYVASEVAALAGRATAEPPAIAVPTGVRDALVPPGSNAFLWSWRIPYYYCHFSDRLQHSGYVRALEEVVDRFLDDRGISIRTMLDERGWIPVVSRARVRMLADAHMEEVVHTVFTVEGILKDVLYDARMDCYVRRGDRLVHTASATILHGYAISRGERAGQLARFGDSTTGALLGGAA